MIGFSKGKKKSRRQRYEPDLEGWSLSSDTKRTLLIIGLFTFSFLGLISLFNGAGTVGLWIKWILGLAFGWSNWLVLLLIIILAYFLLFDEKYQFKKINYFGLFLLLVAVTGLLDYVVYDQTVTEITKNARGGGYVGYFIGHNLIQYLGFWGGMILLLGILLGGIFIFFNSSFRQIVERVQNVKDSFGNGQTGYDGSVEDETEEEEYLEEEEEVDEPLDEAKADEALDEPTDKADKDEPQAAPAGRTYRRIKLIEIPLQLLSPSSGKPTSGDIKANSEKIAKTFETFGIPITMGDINVGPTVTQYTFKPADGVKLSRITALQNDIALSLAAHPIRIEAPIPGKSLVGIEVPNQAVSIVRVRDVLDNEVFKNRKSDLMVTLGKDVTGKSLMADLAKMPHLLIAGATGSGKSVAINSIIVSLLWQNSPSDLKLILVDPKRVELSTYNGIPHLLTPVITETKATINALRWVVNEMDERYKVLASAGKRNIDSYNKALKKNRMPYMVVVIDELADLMAVAAKEVESAIIRLAQMARAVGIHLVLATQRPSVNVITGLIKANITSRIAFAVASSTDSRTIIDISGAEKLLGNGDMLYTSAELSKPRRIQGAFISEKEVEAITNYLREQGGEPDYNMDVSEGQVKGGGSFGNQLDSDEEDLGLATDIIVRSQRASATLLQSRMRIGFAKAARLLELLEDRGIVGPSQGSKPREVLVTEDDLKNNFDPQPADDYEDEDDQDDETDDDYEDAPDAHDNDEDDLSQDEDGDDVIDEDTDDADNDVLDEDTDEVEDSDDNEEEKGYR